MKLRKAVGRYQRPAALLVGSALVVAGVGMVFTPAALVLAGLALIGFFGIDFGRPGA